MVTKVRPRDWLAQEGRDSDAEVMINEVEESSEDEMKQGPGVQQARRSAVRLQRYWRPGAGGSAVDSSVLEENAVQQRTSKRYCQHLQDFLNRCEKAGRKLDTAQEIDMSLVWYLTDLFLRGFDLSKGVYTVIGFESMYPRYGKHGDLGLPRAHRALKGWRRLAPPRSRVGALWYVVAGVAA